MLGNTICCHVVHKDTPHTKYTEEKEACNKLIQQCFTLAKFKHPYNIAHEIIV
jgi:hypothetical protein